jgi:hypothetical protein
MKYLNLGILLLFSLARISAQTLESENNSAEISYQINFGETLPENLLKSEYIDRTIWTITNSADSILFQSVNGNLLQSIKFDRPGEYRLSMHFDESIHSSHVGECFHPSIPEINKLVVSPYRIVFDFENLSISTDIVGGKELSGATLSVPVEYSSYSGNTMELPSLKMMSAGVNTTIQGVLKDEKTTLSPGLNQLTYSLKGSASKNTYIMFDFYDLTGAIQSYSFPTLIK